MNAAVSAVLPAACLDEGRGGAGHGDRLAAVAGSPYEAPDSDFLKYEAYYPDVVAAGSLLAALLGLSPFKSPANRAAGVAGRG